MMDAQQIIAIQKEVIPMLPCPFCQSMLEPMYDYSGGWVTGHTHRANGCILGGNFYGRVFSASWNNRHKITAENPQLLAYPSHMFTSANAPNPVRQPPQVDRIDLDAKIQEMIDAAKEHGDAQAMVDAGTLDKDTLEVFSDDVKEKQEELREMIDKLYQK